MMTAMKTTHRFPRILAAIAAGVLLVTIGVWAATGAHVGWTKTSAITMHHDDVTGIDYPVTRPTFVAGVEVIAVGVAAATTLAGASLVTRRLSPVRG